MSVNKDDILKRAREYPYDFPRHSFTYVNGEARAFDADLIGNRTPVLAIGSNQSPHRLRQKYGHLSEQIIPVQRVHLLDFDVFYCGHITNYGAVGAMLQHSPGTIVELSINWLDPAQLDLMHTTEGNYDFALLENLQLRHADHQEREEINHPVHVYVGQAGHMIRDGSPVAMTAIQSKNRDHPSMTTGELLSHIHQSLHPEMNEEEFIIRLVRDKDFRLSVTAQISHQAIPFSYPFKVI